MSTLAQTLKAVEAKIAAAAHRSGREGHAVRFVLVTKTVDPDRVLQAVMAGARDLGENKVQEGLKKATALAAMTESEPGLCGPPAWSMIGHLQTNKVKEVLRFAHEVQSLDRLSLAVALDKRLLALGRSLDVFVQVNSSQEASKYGLAPEAVPGFLKELVAFKTLKPKGFMTLATFTPDEAEVRRCFRVMRDVREKAQQDSPQGVTMTELSMGMSGDYEWAIEEGATVVRVGQAVFGPRPLPDSYYWPGLAGTGSSSSP